MLTLLLLLSLLTPPSSPPAPASESGVYAYIRDPAAGADAATPGQDWPIIVSVFATVDTPTPVTVRVTLDPRLTLLSRGAIGQAGGQAACIGAGDVVCTLNVQRWREGYVVLDVLAPGGVWPCGAATITATVEADGLPGATVVRERDLAGADSCRYLPMIGGL